MYFIQRGKVLVEYTNHPRRGNTSNVYESGVFIGERASLFDENRGANVSAHPFAEVVRIDGDVFLGLIKDNLGFSRSLSRSLRWKQRIFSSIDKFQAAITASVAQDHLDFDSLLVLYKV